MPPMSWLRVFGRAASLPQPDADGVIAPLWFAAAYPELPVTKARRRARQAGVRRGWGARMTAPNRMVLLTSISSLYATKRIRQDRKTGRVIKTPYGLETYFKVMRIDLAGFHHLCRCLDTLTRRRFVFVIRGAALPDANLEKTRRLVHPDPETDEVATFVAAPRHWFAVDIDKVKKPVAIDPVTDPDGAVEYLIGLLPPELHDASCWWQFTCSQSLPGCEDTLSARLWFWSLDPLDDASLTRWADCANRSCTKLIDRALYSAVQPHYVADPVFEDGMRDPLPRRHGVRVGLDEAISLLIPEPSVANPHVGGAGYVGLGIEGHLAEIGGERGFRAPLVSAIAAYFTANGADANPEPIKARVREAIERADPGGRTAADLDRYGSDRHLNDVIAWVRVRERAKPNTPAQPPGEFLQSLGSSVPVGSERPKAIRAITQHLLRQRYLNPPLARALVEAWNQQHCAPPLPRHQVQTIVNAVASREIERASNV
jgi:hypothetical protein